MSILDQILFDRRDKKRRAEHERRLKTALAQKFSNYESAPSDITASTLGDRTDLTDYTEITFRGAKVRVRTERITIHGLQQDTPETDPPDTDK